MTTKAVYICPVCGEEYRSPNIQFAPFPYCTGNDEKPGGKKHSRKTMKPVGHRSYNDDGTPTP